MNIWTCGVLSEIHTGSEYMFLTLVPLYVSLDTNDSKCFIALYM